MLNVFEASLARSQGNASETQEMICKDRSDNGRNAEFRNKQPREVPSNLPSPDGLDTCPCGTLHVTYGWKRSGFLVVTVTTLAFISMFLPYTAAIATHSMPPFLPFISQAGGSPPRTGLFSIPVAGMCFASFVVLPLLYESIDQRNVHEIKEIKKLNHIAIPFCFISVGACVAATHFPLGFTDLPNQFEWVFTICFPHYLSAVVIIMGAVCYQLMIARIWFLLPDATTTAKYMKLILSQVYVILLPSSVNSLLGHLYEELGPELLNISLWKNSSYDLPLVFTSNYKASAICEWMVGLLSALNFLVMYTDCQRISVHLVLRPKSCFLDATELSPKTVAIALT